MDVVPTDENHLEPGDGYFIPMYEVVQSNHKLRLVNSELILKPAAHRHFPKICPEST